MLIAPVPTRPAPPIDDSGPRGPSSAAVAVVGAALSVLVTVYTLGVYLPTLNTPHTALEGVPHEPSPVPHTPGLARRLAFIIVDGLRFDTARTLEDLVPLRRAGVMRSLSVEFPSYTSPALVSLVTGVGPRDSGIRLNGNLNGVPGLDSVLKAAPGAGVPLRVFLRGWGEEGANILAPPPGTPIYEGRFAPEVDMKRRALPGGEPPPLDGKQPARAFDVFHVGEVDEVAHMHGASSAEYLAEAKNAAAFVRGYASKLDLDQDALVVVSDHGHLPEGGHGGDEPSVSHALFLGVGAFFRRGVELGERPMRDVAATLAVLAGLPTPSSNLGLPMLDALALDDVETSVVLAAPFDQATRFLCRLHPDPRCADTAPLVTRLRKPDPAAWEEAEALAGDLGRARDRDLDERRARGGAIRLAIAAAVLVLGCLAALRAASRRAARRGAWLRALLPAFVNAGVFVAALWALGYRATFSHLLPVAIFARDATPAGLLAAAAVAVLAWRSRPEPWGPWALLGATALPYAVLAAFVGCDPMTPPPNVAGALVFLLGPAIPSAAIGAVAMAWIAARRTGNAVEPHAHAVEPRA